MTAVLTDAEVRDALTTLDGWSGDTQALRRTVELPSFASAIDVVVHVADVAEMLDHHPDVDIRWRTLTFALSTHSAGGVTMRDVNLARRIDTIVDSATPTHTHPTG